MSSSERWRWAGPGVPERMCAVKDCPNVGWNGRFICEDHAYPAERKQSNRREAIEAQKARKKTQVSGEDAEENGQGDEHGTSEGS